MLFNFSQPVQTRWKYHDFPGENIDTAIVIGFIRKTEIDIWQYSYTLTKCIIVFFHNILFKFLSLLNF